MVQRAAGRLLRNWAYLRVLVFNIHILPQNLYYNYHSPKPKYLMIGYLDPLGLYQVRVQVANNLVIAGFLVVIAARALRKYESCGLNLGWEDL